MGNTVYEATEALVLRMEVEPVCASMGDYEERNLFDEE